MSIGHRTDCCARCSLLLVAGILFLATESAADQAGQTGARSAAVNHAIDVAAKPDAPATSDKAEFDLLKAQLAAQQGQIDQLRKLLEAQTKLIEGAVRSRADAPGAANQLVGPPPSGLDQAAATLNSQARSSQEAKAEEGKPSPLRFRIGTVDITPVGYTGSPSNDNRSIQQGTFGFSHTLWRDPSYGGLQRGVQYSYLVRHPWYVAQGQPASANLNVFYLNFRYTLPGAPPAAQK